MKENINNEAGTAGKCRNFQYYFFISLKSRSNLYIQIKFKLNFSPRKTKKKLWLSGGNADMSRKLIYVDQ
jgi:hypothetical protein